MMRVNNYKQLRAALAKRKNKSEPTGKKEKIPDTNLLQLTIAHFMGKTPPSDISTSILIAILLLSIITIGMNL